MAGLYGSDAEAKIVETIALNLDQRGSLDCLRHGVTDRGVKLRLAFFQPATRMNPESLAVYQKNILTITQQVRFSEKMPSLLVDVVLCLNGIPVATAELKNPFTGQTAEHAKRPYRNDRDPSEPLFQLKKRTPMTWAGDRNRRRGSPRGSRENHGGSRVGREADLGVW